MDCKKNLFKMSRILMNNKSWYTLKELIYNNNTIEIKNCFKWETKYNFSKMSKWINTKYFEMFRKLLIITIYINKIESNQLRKISLLI